MKKILVVLAVGVVLVLASCATAPEPQEQAEKPAPPAKGAVALPEQEYAQAKELKSKIDRYGLGTYAPEEYAQAEAKMADAEKAYQKDNAAAKKALDEAIRGYNAVVSKGFPLLAEDRRKQAESAMGQADSVKASRAVPAAYARAKAKYDEGVAARDAGEFEKAVAAFDEARRLFEDAYMQAKAKKERAEQSMRSTQEGLTDAEQRARAGDDELQGAQ